MNGLKFKFITSLIITAMLMTYISYLGNAVFAAYEELEKQGVVSSNKNVEFDSYFKDDGAKKSHVLDGAILESAKTDSLLKSIDDIQNKINELNASQGAQTQGSQEQNGQGQNVKGQTQNAQEKNAQDSQIDTLPKQLEETKSELSIAQNNILYVNINVKETGYLQDGIITIDNPNFYVIENQSDILSKYGIVAENIEANKFIKSIDTEKNQITLNQIDNGENIELAIAIGFKKNDQMNLDYFSRESKVNFAGTYFNGNAKDKNIKSDIKVRVNWNAKPEAELTQNVSKYGSFQTANGVGTYLQTIVTSNLKNNSLPVQNETLNIIAPTLDGQNPDEVKISAETVATNGNTDGTAFSSDMYTYTKETGALQINVKNTNSESKNTNSKSENDIFVSWKDGADTFKITYIYNDKKAVARKISLNAESKITPYVVTNEVNGKNTQDVELGEGQNSIVSLEEAVTTEVPKGYIYTNNKKTEFISTVGAEISYADTVNKIILNINNPQFITKDGKKYQSGNNIYFKQIGIEKAVLDELFGDGENIQIYDQNGNNFYGIDKNASTDENGNILMDISSQGATSLRIETSKPVKEGKIKFTFKQAIKAGANISQGEANNLQGIESQASGTSELEEVTSAIPAVSNVTNLRESATKAEVYTNNSTLTTTNKNENVEIKAVLLSNDNNYDLYKNPIIEMVLPKEVENISLNSINLLYDENMKIAGYEVKSDENGNKIIRVALNGTQQSYVTDISKGINVIVNADITLQKTATSKDTEIGVRVSNENAKTYDNNGYWSTPLKIYAPQGVVLLSSVSNFNAKGSEVVSLTNKEQVGKIETKVASKEITLKSSVINNNGKDIKNPKILGKIPFKGNTKTTGEDLNSTMDTIMTSTISVSGVTGAKIYYSENENPTTDVQNAQNGWFTLNNENAQNNGNSSNSNNGQSTNQTIAEKLSKVKSYLIDLTGFTMPQGSSFDVSYKALIPENLTNNENAFGTYTIYYDEQDGDSNISKDEVAPTTGVSTGVGPEIEGKLEATNQTEDVNTSSAIVFKLTISNKGGIDATNVKVRVPLPEGAVFMVYGAAEEGATSHDYIDDDSSNEKSFSYEKIAVGETKEESFILRFKNEGEGIVNAIVSSDKLDKDENIQSAKFKVEKATFDGIFYQKYTSAHVNVGDTIEYKLRIINSTKGPFKNVKVEFPLDDYVDFEDAYEIEKTTKEENGSTTVKSENIKDNVSFDEKTRKIIFKIKDFDYYSNYIDVKVKAKKAGETAMQVSIDSDGHVTQRTEIIKTNIEEAGFNVSVESNPNKNVLQVNDKVEDRVIVKNTGTAVLKNVKVKFDMSENMEYIKTAYSLNENQIFAGTNNNPKQTTQTTNIDVPGQGTLTLDVETMASKILDSSKGMEDANMTVTVTADNMEPYSMQIKRKIENNSANSEGAHSILGTAWFDSNRNGIRDSGDTTLSNISVTLLNADTGAVAKNSTGNEIKATTDDNGEYSLNDVVAGKYIVQFNYDANKYILTEYKKSGVGDAVNSDATAQNNKDGVALTDNITVTDSNIENIDIGLMEKGTFNLQLNKTITKIGQTDGKNNKTTNFNNKKIAKVDVDGKRTNRTTVVIEYTLSVTNKGNVAGYARKIVDQIPEELEFSSNQNKDWYKVNSGLESTALENTVINPGETKQIKLILTKKTTAEYKGGTVSNKAQISETYNDYGDEDIKDSDDEQKGTANIILGLKTGGAVLYIGLTLSIMAIITCGVYIINKKVIQNK